MNIKFKIPIAFLIFFFVFTNKNYAQGKNNNFGVLKTIGDYDEKSFKNFSSTYKEPLVLINFKIYLPPSDCLEVRKLGGDKEDRKLGGDKEDRKLGGDKEDRKLGGDKEDRKLGGDKEDRKLGGDKEDRKLGGDKEDRKLGGDKEKRKLGGDTSVLKCKKLEKERGFKIFDVNPNSIVKVYYKNKLQSVTNFQVKY